jgi:catechol 2,3-dioxygenase-like lactoylglutathione lyase family enzyme
MINGSHLVLYAEDPERARAFLVDVLALPYVDVHGGWLIFKLPPAELGVHPAGGPGDQPSGPPSGRHELYLLCDDVVATVAELQAKGVEFTTGVEEERWGSVVRFRVPGAGEMGLYQPRHQTAHDLDG